MVINKIIYLFTVILLWTKKRGHFTTSTSSEVLGITCMP